MARTDKDTRAKGRIWMTGRQRSIIGVHFDDGDVVPGLTEDLADVATDFARADKDDFHVRLRYLRPQ